jgi:2-keto-4-pentenoate hydratase/2-oxohepta-3-ene-1,7-dioic acid hydratase in catechol pathway
MPLPFPRPGKVVCVGLNYRDHALEGGLEIPAAPMLFAKFPTSLIGPGDPIRLSTLTEKTDFEAELAVVIGERAKGVPRERAFDVVAGYACFNDVSARDLQRADKQWTRGKSFDTFGPVGPAMVPGSAIRDVQNLSIACRIDGELVQQGNTADMIFGVDEIIEYITQAITLEPGDLIATGTPAGIGAWHDPPRWLRAGDSVAVEIDGVGTLRNPVIAADVADA